MCATRNQREVPENFYRPDNGRTLNWYVRLVPPTPLKGMPGVREFRKSTRTSDLRRAKVVGARLIADKRAEWDQLLAKAKGPAIGPRILTSELIDHICARRLYHWMRLDDKARFEGEATTRPRVRHWHISAKSLTSRCGRWCSVARHHPNGAMCSKLSTTGALRLNARSSGRTRYIRNSSEHLPRSNATVQAACFVALKARLSPRHQSRTQRGRHYSAP